MTKYNRGNMSLVDFKIRVRGEKVTEHKQYNIRSIAARLYYTVKNGLVTEPEAWYDR